METPGGPVDCSGRVVVEGGRVASVHSDCDPRSLPRFEGYGDPPDDGER